MIPDRNKAKEVLTDLKDRFLNGDKLSVKEIVEDYFTAKTPYAYLVLEKKIRNWLTSVKGWFRKEHGLWFGNLNDEGHYGLITTEEEARYSMVRYYRFVKGVIANATLLAKEADEKGLLPRGLTRERMLIAKIEEEDGDED